MRMAEVVTLSITPYINTQSPHSQVTWSEKRDNPPNTQRQRRERGILNFLTFGLYKCFLSLLCTRKLRYSEIQLYLGITGEKVHSYYFKALDVYWFYMMVIFN